MQVPDGSKLISSGHPLGVRVGSERTSASGSLGALASRSVLIVDSTGRGPVTNTVVLSYAAPGYAPAGRHLVQATAVGLHDGEVGAVRDHLAAMYGVPTQHWELIGHYPIAEALPAADPPYRLRSPQDFDGVTVAGDHRDSPSIQGALVSGRRAARSVRRQLA